MLPKEFDIQALRIVETYDEMKKNSRLDDDFFITTMINYRDTYIHVLTNGTNWENLRQTTVWNPQSLKNLGKDEKYIVGMIKHGDLWDVQLASNTGITDQRIVMIEDSDNLKEYIKDQWRGGYDITDLVSDNGKYCVVSSLGLNWKQMWLFSSDYPDEAIQLATNEGKVLTDVISIGDEYLWMFSGNTGFQNQLVKFKPSTDEILFFRESVYSDDGYHGYSLSIIREVMGSLLFVFVR